MKKLSEIKVGKRLSDEELKQINGGIGLEVTGARCYAGQCYCDWYFTDGGYTSCDTPCPSGFCLSMGISC